MGVITLGMVVGLNTQGYGMFGFKKKNSESSLKNIKIAELEMRLDIANDLNLAIIKALGFYIPKDEEGKVLQPAWSDIEAYCKDLRSYKEKYLKIHKICNREEVPFGYVKVYDPDNQIKSEKLDNPA